MQWSPRSALQQTLALSRNLLTDDDELGKIKRQLVCCDDDICTKALCKLHYRMRKAGLFVITSKTSLKDVECILSALLRACAEMAEQQVKRDNGDDKVVRKQLFTMKVRRHVTLTEAVYKTATSLTLFSPFDAPNILTGSVGMADGTHPDPDRYYRVFDGYVHPSRDSAQYVTTLKTLQRWFHHQFILFIRHQVGGAPA